MYMIYINPLWGEKKETDQDLKQCALLILALFALGLEENILVKFKQRLWNLHIYGHRDALLLLIEDSVYATQKTLISRSYRFSPCQCDIWPIYQSSLRSGMLLLEYRGRIYFTHFLNAQSMYACGQSSLIILINSTHNEAIEIFLFNDQFCHPFLLRAERK